MKKFSTNDIYSKWQATNRHSHGLFITYTGLFVSFLMVFGDHLFVSEALAFTEVRIVGICLLLINLMFLKILIPRWAAQGGWRFLELVKSIALVSAIYIYNLQYYLFTFNLKHDKFNVYFTGLLLGVAFGAFMLHRFKKEQYAFHLAFIFFSFGMISKVDPVFQESLYIVVIVHCVSGFVAAYFRQDFIENLISRFNLISAFVPRQLAQHIAVSNNVQSVEEIFKARNRYTVCLCCDWRNYQQLIQGNSADFISSLIEDYYNRVFEALERIDPLGQYYASWNADELFVVFFDLNDDPESVRRRSLEFAGELATRIFLDVRYDFEVDLKYDIGLASGSGFLGLQGPAKLKKTTITGHSAGTAKRLETEAKTIRKTSGANPNPILLIDSELHEASKQIPSFKDRHFRAVQSQVKDLGHHAYYLFQSDFIDVKDIIRQIG